MTLASSNGPVNVQGLMVFHVTQEMFTVMREGCVQVLQVKPTVFLPQMCVTPIPAAV